MSKGEVNSMEKHTEEQVLAWLQAQDAPEAEALLEYLEEQGYGTVGST